MKEVSLFQAFKDMAGIGRGATHGVHGEEAGGEDGVRHEFFRRADEFVDPSADVELALGTAGLEEGADGLGMGCQVETFE